MSKETGSAGMNVGADVIRGAKTNEGAAAKNFYKVECIGPDGKLKWVEEFGNLVVDVGLDSLLERFKTSSTTWFVGLTDGSPPTIDPTDTMASHVGWAEVIAYDEATRESLVLGDVDTSNQSISNDPADPGTGTKASFAINGSVTCGGAFVTTDGAKSGSAGTLYSVGAFGTEKVLTAGDTLVVKVTLSTTAS